MAAFLRLIILAPLAGLVVLLSLANRGPVTLSLDPFGGDNPALTATLPTFVAIIAAVMAGIVIGGIACWFGQGKHRKASRQHRREAEKFKSETERLRLMLPPTAALPPSS